jgi:pimeloyl-ACP methyl ester carboxylesterase
MRARADYLALVVPLTLFSATAAPQALETQDFNVPALDPGIQLHLRNKHPAGERTFAAEKIVLFVHGATYPATSGFDVELPGGSWLGYVAQRGYDAYALDVRGYGGSTRPAAMSQPPGRNPPFADTKEAVRDISAAVEFILERRGAARLNLLGWSWGTSTTASYAAQHASKVHKLVLYAPLWLGARAPPFAGAYRTNTHDQARAFALAGMPKDRVDEVAPLGSFETWWAATLASDPDGARLVPPAVRAPNGALHDISEYWARGKALYDPAQIRAPTLLVVGEWDAITPPAQAQELFRQLTHAQQRRLIVLSDGTHSMAIEKNRLRLMREVQNFLDED